jgi:hypothetical protein
MQLSVILPQKFEILPLSAPHFKIFSGLCRVVKSTDLQTNHVAFELDLQTDFRGESRHIVPHVSPTFLLFPLERTFQEAPHFSRKLPMPHRSIITEITRATGEKRPLNAKIQARVVLDPRPGFNTNFFMASLKQTSGQDRVQFSSQHLQ